MEKINFIKINNALKKTIALTMVAGFVFSPLNTAWAQATTTNDGLQYPREDAPYSRYESESFYPIPTVANSGLASSTQNQIFEKYGELYVDWVNMRTSAWESDRLMCAEDIHDFLYNYIKEGYGNTPSYYWSRLLQPNGFQYREGAWNDFDGDGKINGIVRLKQESLPPQSVDNDGDGNTQGEWDDFYGNGIPNKFDPFVLSYGYTSVDDLMSRLGTSVDEDVDNDGLPNASDDRPFFSTFGDADFSGNDLGKDDMYKALRNPVTLKNLNLSTYQTNEKLESALAGILTDTFGLNGVSGDLSSNGDKVQITGSGLVSLVQIRNLAGNTAYSSEQIYKQLVNNCVIMAGINDSLSRQEYQTLVADAVARELGAKQAREIAKDAAEVIATGFSSGLDTNGDGEIDEKDNSSLIANPSDFKTQSATEARIKANEVINRAKDTNPTLDETQAAWYFNSFSSMESRLASQLSPEQEEIFENPPILAASRDDNPGLLTRATSYLFASIAGTPKSVSAQVYADPNFSFNYWDGLKKKFGLGADNPLALYITIDEYMSSSQDKAIKDAEQILLSGNGFLPERICVKTTENGKACEEWVTITPGSVVKTMTEKILGISFDEFMNTDSVSDTTNNE